jgi:hypothetical protein
MDCIVDGGVSISIAGMLHLFKTAGSPDRHNPGSLA